MLNLLSNAVKFTHAGGEVRLSVSQTDAGVTFVVADTGVGMRAEDILTALKPFQQLDGSLARRHEGAGLGLPLAKRLAELHGGVLEITSRPGKGTQVIVRLPKDRIGAPDKMEDVTRNDVLRVLAAGVLNREQMAAQGMPRSASGIFGGSADGTGTVEDRSEVSDGFMPNPPTGAVTPASSPLDWQRIANWTNQIAAEEVRDIARVFAANGLPAPVVMLNLPKGQAPRPAHSDRHGRRPHELRFRHRSELRRTARSRCV
jgi:hypothetical protein